MSPMSLLCYGWGGRRGWDVFRFPIRITRARGGQSCPPVLLSKNVLMSKNVQASREKISALQKNVTAARVRRLIAVFAVWLSAIHAAAQIPYYAGTVGDGKMYTYTSLKSRPGINHQETYTTFQYGLGDHWATGADLYTGPDCAYWGALVRYGHKFCQWLRSNA